MVAEMLNLNGLSSWSSLPGAFKTLPWYLMFCLFNIPNYRGGVNVLSVVLNMQSWGHGGCWLLATQNVQTNVWFSGDFWKPPQMCGFNLAFRCSYTPSWVSEGPYNLPYKRHWYIVVNTREKAAIMLGELLWMNHRQYISHCAPLALQDYCVLTFHLICHQRNRCKLYIFNSLFRLPLYDKHKHVDRGLGIHSLWIIPRPFLLMKKAQFI